MQKRSRLSSVQLLPEPCLPAVQWAWDELVAKTKTQVEIYAEFLVRVGPFGQSVSPSAFNRWSIKVETGSAKRPKDRVTAPEVTALTALLGTVPSPETLELFARFLLSAAADQRRGR